MKENKEIKREFGLTSLAVDNKTSVILLTLIIVIFGMVSYVTMPKEQFPEVVLPNVYVGTPYPGNSPVDIENLVTRPIEKELKGITGVKDITSTSVQDYSTILIEFNPDVEKAKALQDVKDAVDQAKSELPDDLPSDPTVQEVNLSDVPIMFVNISGNYSTEELKDFAEYLQDEIEKLPEISYADLRGTREREVKINADLYKMEAVQVNFSDIEGAVANENVTISGGDLLSNGYRRSIRVTGEFTDPDELNDIVIKNENGNVVYLRDVADVEYGFEEPESFARQNKLPVVTLDVVKRSGENLIAAADQIKEIVAEAQATRFPNDLEITITNDQSRRTKDQLSNLENSIISGVILVVLVLLFFMGLRNALFVGVAIPMSMFMAFMLLNLFGVTINLMVLFSLILALGMLVDNGIVVVENTYRLMQQGYSPIRAAKEGAGEVAVAIIASTATTVAAFVPLAFWSGIIGEFMKYLPITLIITLSSSLFVALVINPVLTRMYMKAEESARTPKRQRRLFIVAGTMIGIGIICYFAQAFTVANLLVIFALFALINFFFLTPASDWFQEKGLPRLESRYERLLDFALRGRNPLWFFGGTFLLLILSLMLLGVRQPQVLLFPNNEPEYINVFVEEPIGTDIETTNAFTKKLENEIIALMQPYDYMIESIIAQVGQGTSDPAQGPSFAATPNRARITVSFEAFNQRRGQSTIELMEKIRDRVGQYPGVLVTVDKNASGPPVGKPINLEIVGEDYEKLVALAQDVQRQLEAANIPGVEGLRSDLETGKPELLVDIDREKARRFGLSTGQVAMELRTALFGKEVSQFKDGEDEYPIQLRLKDEQRYDVDALINKTITFRDKFGKLKQVPIISVANVDFSSTYGSVKRKDLDRVISIYSNVTAGYNPTEIIKKMQNILADYKFPEGFSYRFTGEQEEQAKSMAFLVQAMAIAVFAIFLIIVTQFNSLSAPFIIMCSVLFSTIGVFLGLVIFNMDFIIIMTGIGVISLAGVVVNNAIVLLDYTDLIRKRRRAELGIPDDERLSDEDLRSSIVDAGKTRLRPVLLTAITTVLGLIPLAIGLNIDFIGLLSNFNPDIYYGGDNAIFWGPMAWTVIFGLTFATFLTLVIVPVMYLIADKLAHRTRRAVAQVS
ncbi:Multidrug efflux pump subunit AcrB [Catalinimonas alkaloidigena]|uniref:Multidrug efflux pump subunit AcrB n=1 Tax=Catalinimonas alkaloidigena TaxID=1075417 RepID=A0A1G9PIG5_9BACT|nr:efflux RND transporter permease subunit [Catalinimonas alkaloidigena]SDL98281.1 Multidrug efflux pump subunit AcrB [Catalinimonas alkaloidigena]